MCMQPPKASAQAAPPLATRSLRLSIAMDPSDEVSQGGSSGRVRAREHAAVRPCKSGTELVEPVGGGVARRRGGEERERALLEDLGESLAGERNAGRFGFEDRVA